MKEEYKCLSFVDKVKADDSLGWKYYQQGILVFQESGIGITSVKKARKQSVTLGMRSTVLESMVRSLNREVGKFYEVEPFWKVREG